MIGRKSGSTMVVDVFDGGRVDVAVAYAKSIRQC